MKPSRRARYAAAITQSKGKMYEYRVPIDDHIELPQDLHFEEQFPLSIGIIGDFAVQVINKAIHNDSIADVVEKNDIKFAAEVLRAFVESKLNSNLSSQLLLLGAAAFYLSEMPGNSIVLCKKFEEVGLPENDPLALSVGWVLDRPWEEGEGFSSILPTSSLLKSLQSHFEFGGQGEEVKSKISELRSWAYELGTPHELLLADILGAIASERVQRSAWSLLPKYSDLQDEIWRPYLERPQSVKELWPSQILLGEAGLYSGNSAVIQMPTSAGKTRATELIIRSAFLSGRTKLAVVVAPFRALCHEIANSLELAFYVDRYRVNQLSDAIQADYISELEEILEGGEPSSPVVIVVTPEKFLYILRQEPEIAEGLGLVVYDEGHQFDTGHRGVTYELLLTSIKRLLNDAAQSVLISAVIQNPSELAGWLLNNEEFVVSDNSLQTNRSIGFVSWPLASNGQIYFNHGFGSELSYFVPRVIVAEQLNLHGKEVKQHLFPERESWSVALYLGLRLVPNGGVAIFTGTKISAAKIVREAAEDIFPRGLSLPPPSESSDADELNRLVYLFEENFGQDSYLTKAAKLGIFSHHGNTPHGIRLAIENAMRDNLIRFVICTSTLAQGVNLPIRYLLITIMTQGNKPIKARDFHNLMGRAGRAGIHGEGTVIFTDPEVFDRQSTYPAKWNAARSLLVPSSFDPTGSSLLEIFKPIHSEDEGQALTKVFSYRIVKMLIEDREKGLLTASNPDPAWLSNGFTISSLEKQLAEKCEVLDAIESFLMSYREDLSFEDFVITAANLAKETFAYKIGDVTEKEWLVDIFMAISGRIEEQIPDLSQQARYGKTLLSIDSALKIDNWVLANLTSLRACHDEESILECVWPLLVEITPEKRIRDTTPSGCLLGLAMEWISGKSYKELLDYLTESEARFPYGKLQRRFNIDLVVELCEQTFGYEIALLLAAFQESVIHLVDDVDEKIEFKQLISTLQKRIKYGLPNSSSVFCFESGFSERVIAQSIDSIIGSSATSVGHAKSLIQLHPRSVGSLIELFPSYFHSIYKSIR